MESAFLVFNAVIPTIIILQILFTFKKSRQIETLILLPSLVYISCFYIFYVVVKLVLHINTLGGALQLPLRIGITLLFISLFIQTTINLYRQLKR